VRRRHAAAKAGKLTIGQAIALALQEVDRSPDLKAYSGARKSEAADVLWRDVDFQRNTVLLRKTKNGYPRVIPLITELRLLNCLKKSRPFDTRDSPVMVVREAQNPSTIGKDTF
jgi:integrase